MNRRFELMQAMHTIICAMNDEDAYMRWIYLVPDEATDEDLREIAEDDEFFADVCKAFRRILNDHGAAGFYVNKKVW